MSTIKPEGVQKVDIELSAKYDPAKHKMFIDAETGEPTGVVNCDRFKDFPVDWPGLVAIPVTTLIKIANQKTRVIDVYGYKSRGDNKSPNMELVDSNAIHGEINMAYTEGLEVFERGHKIIKVKLEDGRVPFQRIVVKLNRERRSK